MTKRPIFLFLLLFLTMPIVYSQSPDDPPRHNPAVALPAVILSGLDGYKSKGAEEAVRLWVKDSPLEGGNDAASQVAALHQIEQQYGAYQWYEIVSTREITPRALAIYVVLDYERGPLFVRFTIYRSNHRWIMTDFDFNTREENIFPPIYTVQTTKAK